MGAAMGYNVLALDARSEALDLVASHPDEALRPVATINVRTSEDPVKEVQRASKTGGGAKGVIVCTDAVKAFGEPTSFLPPAMPLRKSNADKPRQR